MSQDPTPPQSQQERAACRVLVCTSCSLPDSDRDAAPRDGRKLFDAVRHAASATALEITVVGVSCMSNCNRACSVAFTGENKVSYLFGDQETGPDVARDIVAMAKLHAESEDGITVWRDRPERIRAGLVARIPPFGFDRNPVQGAEPE